jgi:hypothetical protein
VIFSSKAALLPLMGPVPGEIRLQNPTLRFGAELSTLSLSTRYFSTLASNKKNKTIYQIPWVSAFHLIKSLLWQKVSDCHF